MNPDYEPERRVRRRIQGPISARVQGIDADGREFDFEAVVGNMSATGLYVRLARRVEESAKLSFLLRLPPGTGIGDPGTRLAATGIVRRVESCADDTCGLGVEFTRCRNTLYV